MQSDVSVCSRFSFELISFSLHTYILNWGDTSYTHVGCCALRYHHELLTFSRRLRWKFLSFYWMTTYFFLYKYNCSEKRVYLLSESTCSEGWKNHDILLSKISFEKVDNFIPNFWWFPLSESRNHSSVHENPIHVDNGWKKKINRIKNKSWDIIIVWWNKQNHYR